MLKIEHAKYSHLSFDLWATLIRSNSEFKSKRDVLFRDFFEIDCQLEKLSEVIRYYDVLCNRINENTGLNLDTYEIYYLILGALNIDISTIETTKLNRFYDETELLFMKYKPLLIYPDINLFLNEIRQQEKTVNVLSNTAFIKGVTMKKLMTYYEMDTYFSFQIYSDEVALSKPNYQIFQLVYKEVGKINKIEKKQILHIGDNAIADYKGALSFGFDALLINV